MNRKIIAATFLLISLLSFEGFAQKWWQKTMQKADEINLLTIEQEMELGKNVKKEIEADPKKYPILAESGNEQIYAYVRGITQKILNSGKVAYKSKFAWEVKIINDDKTLNAFCTPGGYIYVYTGIIKFLDSEDQLAGVMGHEIAHAAQRHSGRAITKAYGIDMVLNFIIGGKTNKNVQMVKQITEGVVGLRFSRGHETEADEYSVTYLCATGYNAAGAAGFFKKIQSKSGTPPEFLSTHPDPKNRVKDIEDRAKTMGCSGSDTGTSEYAKMKALLK
jgi:beta-barrel assembly-enhancing protease